MEPLPSNPPLTAYNPRLMTAVSSVSFNPVQRPFLDVATLLEASEPRRQTPRVYLFIGGLAGIMVLSAIMHMGRGTALADAPVGLLLVGLAIWIPLQSRRLIRQFKDEQQRVNVMGEMIQLRRWTDAAGQLDAYLSRPARTSALRIQALVFLCVVLTRYQRFEDAIAVYTHLIDDGQIDAQSAYTLRLGRAMAILSEERLVDADRAITDLRRNSPPGVDASALGLVELYRDVKTGHSQDAIERFEKLLPAFRQSLGHRLADAWMLVARAYDLLGRSDHARSAFMNATLLAPPAELYRRYPETKRLEGRYDPAYAPAEAA